MSRPCRLRPLPATELIEWIALRRVRWGGVALYGVRYLDHGRRVPCYLDEPLDELRRRGLVELVERPEWCVWRVVLTRAGASGAASRPPSGHPSVSAISRPATHPDNAGRVSAPCRLPVGGTGQPGR